MSNLSNIVDYVDYCWSAARHYCDGVQNGTIKCNENIILAVKRHVDDIERYDLEWHEEAVEKVFKFFFYINLDKDKHFIPEPFQAFIIVALFGLYYKDTDVRKYLYAFLFIGRKNAKTTFAAILQLYFMMADGQSYPKSLLISASQTNAKDTSFSALEEIIKWSPALKKRLQVMKSSPTIRFAEVKGDRKLGWCKTTVMDMDKLEGYNPTSCILDEIHTYKDAQKFNVIKNGLGTKKNPMLFLISTGGYGTDTFCTELVKTGRRVLRNEIEDDRFFYLLYELEEGDDWKDKNVWIKANPGLGTIIDKRLFEDSFKSALNKPNSIELRDFKTKRFNMFLEETSDWISPETINLNTIKGKLDESVIKALPCYVGVDLSKSRDLTSVVCIWIGDKIYIRSFFFIVDTDENINRKRTTKIQEWINNHYIIPANDDGIIDYGVVKNCIQNIKENYNLIKLGYDNWHFDMLLNDVKQLRINCKEISPFTRDQDPAIRLVEDLFHSNRIVLEENECMKWNFSNAVIGIGDENGNYKLKKKSSLDAIDGIASLLNAIRCYQLDSKLIKVHTQ